MSEMNVANVSNTSGACTGYQANSADRKQETEKADKKQTNEAAVYEKSKDSKSATYHVNRMSSSERAALVARLKADQENRQSQLASLVSGMMRGQANAYARTDDGMWKFLAGGNYSVDAKTRAQAQADIAEDGYWGVRQTSQRLFDFASALAGDDVEKMKQMQAAMEKGFQKATKSWGGSLPGICHDTMKAANQLFEDYYASKKTAE